jgi:hypothetical protein
MRDTADSPASRHSMTDCPAPGGRALYPRTPSPHHPRYARTSPSPLPSASHVAGTRVSHALILLVSHRFLSSSFRLLTSLSPMPKPKLKAGVSRRVKFSQTGPHGQAQALTLNQPALARRREAAAKGQSDLLQGTSYLGYSQPTWYSVVFLLYLGLGDEC